MSNYQKKRGFLDPNRMMQPPTFDPNRHQTTQPNAAGDSNSNTALLNNMAGAENSSHTQVIWGTNINTNDVQNKLKNFIHNFELINEESDEENDEKYIKESHYISKLHEIRQVD